MATVGHAGLLSIGAVCAACSAHRPSDASWSDTSPHRVSMIEVAPAVRLEVLDWGGSGPPLVFLAGLDDVAHGFDDFAPRFTDHYHVLAITRRGYGASTQTKTGYDITTRVADLRAVLDALALTRVALVGHSIAGGELTAFAGMYPDRVSQLVYLDAAFDHSLVPEIRLRFPPPKPPSMSEADKASPAAVQAYTLRTFGVRIPEAQFRSVGRYGPTGKFLGAVTSTSIDDQIWSGCGHPDYSKVSVPVLAIYSDIDRESHGIPYWTTLDPTVRRAAEPYKTAIQAYRAAEHTRFREAFPNAPVIELHEANHYVFYSNEAEVERAMRGFLGGSDLATDLRPKTTDAAVADPLIAGAQIPSPVRTLTLAEQEDSDALRVLVKATPVLPLDRVELKLNLPMMLGPVSAMTADKQGNIYVLHRPGDTKTDPVVVLDASGNFIRSFGKGMYSVPHGIRIDPSGNVWTIDAHTSMVYKFSPEGKKLLEVSVGDIPDSTRTFCGATDVAFNESNGHFYVSDGYTNSRFIEYAADGKKVREWGNNGTRPGEFKLPHDIAFSADKIIYVADRENGRVQWFDQNGKQLGEKHFGGQLFSVALGPDGKLYVGTHAKGVAFEIDSNIFKFDPKTGKIIGRVDAFAHQLDVAADGTLLPGTINIKIGNDPKNTSILIFRPRKTN